MLSDEQDHAQEYAAELLEAAADVEWAGLLGTGLNAETIEAIRTATDV